MSKTNHTKISKVKRKKTHFDSADESESIHFRRCHICGSLNHSKESLVEKCSHCQKSLAPFVFFDEKKAMGLSDESPDSPNKKAPSYKITRLATETIYPPIWGLTVYW